MGPAFHLLPPQMRVLRSSARETWILKAGPTVGASHTLRAAAIAAAMQPKPCRVAICGLSDQIVRSQHVHPPLRGLPEMLRELERQELCKIGTDEIGFSNGSRLTWCGLNGDSSIRRLQKFRPEVVLADDADRLPSQAFEAVAAETRGRLVGVATATPSGWLADRFRAVRPETVEFPKDTLPDHIRESVAIGSYAEWLSRVHGAAWKWPPHVVHGVDSVDRWIQDEWDHLALIEPSQHAKTTKGPRNGIPYILDPRQYPSDWTSVISYASGLANSRSQDARDNYIKAGGLMPEGHQRINEWRTIYGGGCWSAGMAAGQAGKSATWMFLDDVDKNWQDAVSKTAQEKKRRNYRTVIRDRESMFADQERKQKILVTATRWDPEDMLGFMLRLGEESGERWAVLVMPALYDPKIRETYQELYPSAVILPDFRTEPGEPLWPERRSREEWEKRKIIMGPMIFEAEAQQNPKALLRGGIFRAEDFIGRDVDPAFAGATLNEGAYLKTCRAWDLGATEGAGDSTAGSKMGSLKEGKFVIRHCVRAQLSPARVRMLIACCMILDGPRVTIRIPDDPAAGGKAAAEAIVSYLRKVATLVGMQQPTIVVKPPLKGRTSTLSAKAARARTLASISQPPGKGIPGAVSIVEADWKPAVSDVVKNYERIAAEWPELREIAGMTRHFSGRWQTALLQEMEAFTGDDGREDDQVDATVDAHAETSANKKGGWVIPY